MAIYPEHLGSIVNDAKRGGSREDRPRGNFRSNFLSFCYGWELHSYVYKRTNLRLLAPYPRGGGRCTSESSCWGVGGSLNKIREGCTGGDKHRRGPAHSGTIKERHPRFRGGELPSLTREYCLDSSQRRGGRVARREIFVNDGSLFIANREATDARRRLNCLHAKNSIHIYMCVWMNRLLYVHFGTELRRLLIFSG